MTRRFGIGYRALFAIFAAAMVVLACMSLLHAGSFDSRFVAYVLAALYVGLAILFRGFAVSGMVASDDAVTIRNPFDSHTLRWVDVKSVVPTRSGLCFELAEGRHVTAIATARSGFRWGRLRFDAEALSYAQARVGRANQ